jgi:glyoxylase-like metal-dependent hydrolase (beta-lactamase superfamily II)
MASALPPFVETLPDGVIRLGLRTPFPVGRVNCYLLPEPPVTLIDPGTLHPGSIEEIERALCDRGLRGFEDVEQVVVTHGHPDHFGAAATVAARSGAQIVCGLPDAPSLTGPTDVQSRRETLVRLGVLDATARALVAGRDAGLEGIVSWADPSVVRGVPDGTVLAAGGRRLVCVITPGHTDGHLSLWDPAARVLFSGDHLLARIIPVPSLQAGTGSGRRRSFVEYLSGLPRFVALDPAAVLPGHGRAFTGVGVLSNRTRNHSQQRAEAIAALLADGPATPFELARRLQSDPEGARLQVGLAHVQGHLDLLEEAGRVAVDETAAAVRYQLTG